MDHLAIPSSHVANLDIIEEQEDANTLPPSSSQSTPNAQHTYASTSSGFGHLSGTPNDIQGDEDVESITTFDDEYYDARSEIASISSIYSLRTLKSQFCRLTSASKESLASVQSKFFGPSYGTRNMNIRQLVQYLRKKHSISNTEILDMTTYRCRSVIKHMFVVLRLKQGDTECWLRLDRRVEDPFNASFIFSSMQGPAMDVAKAASTLEELIEASDVNEHSRIIFEEPPSLKVLESLLVAIYEESKDYRIWPENCWFFCSLIQEHLCHRYGGEFAFGELYRPSLGSDARGRISGRLDGLHVANLSVSWSRSLLYRVRPPKPSAPIAEATVTLSPFSRPLYLLFIPDGTRILCGTDRGIWVWDLSLRELINIRTEDALQVGDWASLLDDRIIVSGSSKGSYNFWDATDSTPIRFCTASRGSEGLDFRHLVSPHDNLTTQRWERVIRDADRWQGDPRVRNEVHNRVAYISKGSILVDEKSSNTRITNLHVGPGLQEDIMLSPSGKSISFRLDAPRSDSLDPHYDNYLWNIDTQTVYRLKYLTVLSGRGWSPDGHCIATRSRPHFNVWDTRTGALVSILDFNPGFGHGKLLFSPDGQYFAIIGTKGEVRLWDMKVALLRGPYQSNPPLSTQWEVERGKSPDFTT